MRTKTEEEIIMRKNIEIESQETGKLHNNFNITELKTYINYSVTTYG